MGELVRAHDWSSSPIGAPERWPQALRTVVRLMLNTGHPMYIFWGPEGTCFYNDAYRRSIGPERHPVSLGQPARKVWDEIWDIIGPQVEQVMAGRGATWHENALVPITRHGKREDVYWTYSYSPIDDDTAPNGVGGVLVVCTETTEAVESSRRKDAEQERQRMLFRQMPGFVAVLTGPEHVFEYVNDAYVALAGKRDFVGRNVREVFPELEGQPFFGLMDRVYTTGEPYVARGVSARLTSHPGERFIDLLYEPIRDDAGKTIGIFVGGYDITESHIAAIYARALADLGDRIREIEDPDDLAYAAAEILGRTLQVSRAGYGTINVAEETITIERDWNMPGVQSLAGVLHFRDYGSYIEDLKRGVTVVFADAEKDPRTAATANALKAISAQSVVNMPVTEQGGFVALLYLNHADAREWTEGELNLIRDVAERTRTAVERRRAENALRASEESVRALTRAMPNQAWTATPDGMLDWFNKRVTDYFGANEVQLEGVGWTSYVHPDDMESASARWGAALKSGDTYETEFRLRRNDGEYRWHIARAVPIKHENGRVARWIGTNTDIHDQKEAARILADINADLERRVAEALAERKLLADIIQNADAFVQVADVDLRWMAINDASAAEFERIFGVRPKVGERMGDILAHVPEQAAAVDAVWRRALAEAPFVEVQQFGNPGRDRRFYEMRYYPLLDAAGQRVGAYQIVYDVTERLNEQERLKQAEEALRQSQKMEAIGQLTGGLAHDFNNLLGGVSGSLELLEKRIAEGRLEGVQRYITSAQEASRRAASLTQRLLAFSRRQTLDPKPVDANKLIVGMEELVRRTVGPGIAVEVAQAGGLWPTKVDAPQLENALLNLCINARDAMAPGGGRLTIETANKWLDERMAKERELPPGQYVSICVTDTGVGMTPEVIVRAFDPFFTTKPIGQGTGLGLSMVYGFVRQSNGQVRIYSEIGKGTTMCLYLPRFFGQVDEQPAGLEEQIMDKGAGETVLVIDDEPILRMLVIDVLEEAGYRAIEAVDGPSGLKVLQSEARIDLLITDVGLPGGMNGRQVADAARKSRPDLKVLFITGYAENALIGNGHLEPGMQVLTKPFPVATLGQRIRDLIES